MNFYKLLIALSEAQARRGEETEYEPEQFQDPDNEMGLFAGMTYEADDEEADKIYEFVDKNMDARRRARRCVEWSVAFPGVYERSDATFPFGYQRSA